MLHMNSPGFSFTLLDHYRQRLDAAQSPQEREFLSAQVLHYQQRETDTLTDNIQLWPPILPS